MKKNYIKPEMNIVKVLNNCQLLAGSPLSSSPGWNDGYSNHEPDDDIDL